MPLFELFRLAKGKLDPTQEKPTSSPPDSSPITGNDFSELTLENGQVLLQGQCNSRDKKSLSLNTNSLPPHSSKLDGEDNEREGKMGILGCGLSEFPASFPSAGIRLNQEDEMGPWLHYPISGSLNGDYSSDFLSELPGVTVEENSLGNNFASVVKSDQGQLCREPLFGSLQSRSGLEEGTRTKTSNMQLLPSSLPLQSQTPPASGLKLQREDFTPSSNTSSVMNFPYFSRPTTIIRSNIESDNKVAGLDLSHKEWIRSRDVDADVTNTSNPNLCCQTSVPRQGAGLKIPDVKSFKGPVSTLKHEAVILGDGLKEDKFSNQSWRMSGSKGGVADVEKTLETTGGSSSDCSGNGVERALDDLKHGFKRKSHETEESEGRSEDVEEELVSAKKQTTARDTPSRRSRAAEVHNLSERRRRDRINEKMRALQELIPNCNKVDKASMLDEAIEYIKTLKLQLQMATLGAGLYMMPMMLPTGMQHLGHLPHYPNIGMGVGHGLEFGMGMFHKNMQGRHVPVPLFPGMHAMPGTMYGLHGQGLPLPMPRAPLFPLSGSPMMKPATGPKNADAPAENHDPATVSSGRESLRSINVQSVQKTSCSCLTERQPRSQSVVAPSSGQASDKKRARGVSN